MLLSNYLLSETSRLLKHNRTKKITKLASQKPSLMRYQEKIIYWNKSFEGSYYDSSSHKSSESMGTFPLSFRFLSQSTRKGNIPNIQAMLTLKENKKQNLWQGKGGKEKGQICGTPVSQNSWCFSPNLDISWMNKSNGIHQWCFQSCSYISKCIVCIRIVGKSSFRCNVLVFFYRRLFLYLFWIVINQSNRGKKKKEKKTEMEYHLTSLQLAD